MRQPKPYHNRKYARIPRAGRKALLLGIGLLVPALGRAQCAMCRAVLESNADNGMAEGINNGIIYLMAIPYLVVGALIFLVYRKLKA